MQIGRLSSSSVSSYKPRLITMNNNNNRSSTHQHGQCKRHPKHRQSPGVCSLCLSEKLSKVSNTANNSTSYSSYSRARGEYYCSSSSLSSSEDESYTSSPSSSPPQHHHRRIASDVMVRFDGGAASSAGRGFGKSRSMAAVAAQQDGARLRSDNNDKSNSKKVISGFWAKILRPRRNKKSREINVNVNGVDRKVLIKNISQSQPLGASTSTSTAVY